MDQALIGGEVRGVVQERPHDLAPTTQGCLSGSLVGMTLETTVSLSIFSLLTKSRQPEGFERTEQVRKT